MVYNTCTCTYNLHVYIHYTVTLEVDKFSIRTFTHILYMYNYTCILHVQCSSTIYKCNVPADIGVQYCSTGCQSPFRTELKQGCEEIQGLFTGSRQQMRQLNQPPRERERERERERDWPMHTTQLIIIIDTCTTPPPQSSPQLRPANKVYI